MSENHGIDARRIANRAFGVRVEIRPADADGGDADLDFAGPGIGNGILGEAKLA
jgi:hypothetical protein